MTDLIKILSDPKYAITVFAYAIVIGVPSTYFGGIVGLDKAIILESLFIASIIAANYVQNKEKTIDESKDELKKDPYLNEKLLRKRELVQEPGYRTALMLVFLVGTPLIFAFDFTTTGYSILTLFDNPAAAAVGAWIASFFDAVIVGSVFWLAFLLFALFMESKIN